VPPSNPFYPFIHCLACRSIVNGYTCGGLGEPCYPQNNPYFRPYANIIRGQAAKIIANSAGYTDAVPTTRQTFTDVPGTQPFWLWIERVASRNIISGYDCGGSGEPCDSLNRPYYRPFNNLSRGQLAKITTIAANIGDPIPPTQQTFTDVPPNFVFWQWIERLAGRGYISGYDCGGLGEPCDPLNRPYFRPYNDVTRSQASKIVANSFFPNCQTPAR
jgi:hypothetical protein